MLAGGKEGRVQGPVVIGYLHEELASDALEYAIAISFIRSPVLKKLPWIISLRPALEVAIIVAMIVRPAAGLRGCNGWIIACSHDALGDAVGAWPALVDHYPVFEDAGGGTGELANGGTDAAGGFADGKSISSLSWQSNLSSPNRCELTGRRCR